MPIMGRKSLKPKPRGVITDTLCARIHEELGIALEEVGLDADFAVDLGADELDIVEIVMIAEDTFQISIDDEEADELRTVGDLVARVERLTRRAV